MRLKFRDLNLRLLGILRVSRFFAARAACAEDDEAEPASSSGAEEESWLGSHIIHGSSFVKHSRRTTVACSRQVGCESWLCNALRGT